MKTMTTTLKIEGMHCGRCASHVGDALRGVEGVTEVRVDLGANEAVVEHDNVPAETLIAAVEEEGYTAKA